MVSNYSTLQNDLYVVYEGKNPDTDKPIIKVFINPLVNWIWIGVGVVIFGTLIALVPPLLPPTRRVEVHTPHAPPLPHTPGAAPASGFARSTLPSNPLPNNPGAPHV
jgi:cytochrome c-type biogenesis protein CcmF